jgi:hypothetical protein
MMKWRAPWSITLLAVMASALAACEPRPPKPKTADEADRMQRSPAR